MAPTAGSETVSFRLRGALLQRLNERAEEARLSRGDCARKLLAASLQDERHEQMLGVVNQLRGEVGKLRADLSATLEVLLLNLAQGVSEEQAREFVSKHLRG